MREYEQQNPKVAKKRQASNFSSLSAFKEEFLKVYLTQRQEKHGDQRYDRNFTLSWGKYSEHQKKRHFQYKSFDGSNFKDSFSNKEPALLSQPGSGTPKVKLHKLESDRLQTDPGSTEKIDTITQGFYLKNYWSNSSRGRQAPTFSSQTDIKSPLKTSGSICLEDGNIKGSAVFRGLQERFSQDYQTPTKSPEKPNYFVSCPYSKNPRRRPKISINACNSFADDTVLGEKAQSASPSKIIARNGKDSTVQELGVKAEVLKNIKHIDDEIMKGLSSKSPTLKSIKLPKINENRDQKEKHIIYQNQARILKPLRKAH